MGAQHTPLPWKLGQEDDFTRAHTPINSEHWEGLAQVVTRMDGGLDTEEAKANAKFIERAVNAHYGLVDLVERAKGMIMCSRSAYEKFQSDADAILSQARGEA